MVAVSGGYEWWLSVVAMSGGCHWWLSVVAMRRQHVRVTLGRRITQSLSGNKIEVKRNASLIRQHEICATFQNRLLSHKNVQSLF